MSQSSAKSIIASSPLAARSRPKLPATSTMQSVVPDTLAKIEAVRGAVALLEHELVGPQPERIAGQLERDVVVAAELELGGGIELALGQVGRELDLAGGQHVGRHRDDGGAGVDAAARGLDLDAAAARRPVDARDRRRRAATGKPAASFASSAPKPCRQNASTSRSAERAKSSAEISRKVLAAAERAEHELDRSARQSPRSFGSACAQATSALRAASAMRGGRAHQRRRDSPPSRLRAHSGGRCARAGRAAPDRCRARSGCASFATGLMSGMWIQCAPRSYGTPNVRGVGDAAPADRCGGLDQREAPAGRREPPRRRDAGGAGADDHDVDIVGRDGAFGAGADFCDCASAGAAVIAAEAARTNGGSACHGGELR